MSRLSTKQRRARAWRRNWVEHVRLIRLEDPPPGWSRQGWWSLAPVAASYSEAAERQAGGKLPWPFVKETR